MATRKRKCTGGLDPNNIRRNPAIQALHQKVISLSRVPAVLANHYKELAVPTSWAQLRNQQGAGNHH
jgi:hypothetical protein